jgi:hypothetical protein
MNLDNHNNLDDSAFPKVLPHAIKEDAHRDHHPISTNNYLPRMTAFSFEEQQQGESSYLITSSLSAHNSKRKLQSETSKGGSNNIFAAKSTKTTNPIKQSTKKNSGKPSMGTTKTSKVTGKPSGNPGKKTKSSKGGGGGGGKYDLDGNGTENIDDIIFLARSIADPLGKFPTGNLSVDINGDGKLDLQDLNDTIAYMFTIVADPDDLLPLTPNMIDNALSQFPPIRIDTEAAEVLTSTRYLEKHVVTSMQPPAWAVVRQDHNHRQLETCGLGTFGRYGKGDRNKDPPRTWKESFPYDPNISPNAEDYVYYAVYVVGVPDFFLLKGWLEAALAFSNYMPPYGKGINPRPIDYEKAYRNDGIIQAAVQKEVDEVLTAVKQMHNGEESSFEFFSTKPNDKVRSDAGGEWQAVLGRHQIWSSGSVTYDLGTCNLSVDIIIKAEDFYDFNKEDGKWAGTVPGRFSTLGWAKGYISSGQKSVKGGIVLQCCKDEDCGDPTQFECECSLCTTQCPTQQRSGGQGFTSFSVNMFKTKGTFSVSYQMYTVPDQLKIYYEGAVVFSTGGLVSGGQTVGVTYGSNTTTSTTVTVEINAPEYGTVWDVSVSCPP